MAAEPTQFELSPSTPVLLVGRDVHKVDRGRVVRGRMEKYSTVQDGKRLVGSVEIEIRPEEPTTLLSQEEALRQQIMMCNLICGNLRRTLEKVRRQNRRNAAINEWPAAVREIGNDVLPADAQDCEPEQE